MLLILELMTPMNMPLIGESLPHIKLSDKYCSVIGFCFSRLSFCVGGELNKLVAVKGMTFDSDLVTNDHFSRERSMYMSSQKSDSQVW